MIFIPLSDLKQLTAAYGNMLEVSGRQNILEQIKGQNNDFGKYSTADIIEVVESLNPEKIVFYGWIDQNNDLIQLLKGTFPTKPFKDTNLWMGHALFPSFSDFLTPFLVSSCLKFKSEQQLSRLSNLFSFLPLMRNDERMVLEQELYKKVNEKLKTLFQQTKNSTNENDLLQLTESICCHEVLAIINLLSRSSYHLKVAYIDQVLAIFEHPFCTPRLGYRIVSQLQVLELNPEHKLKLGEVEVNLKRGNLLQDKITPKRRINFRQIASLFTLVVLIFSAYYLFNYKPLSPKDEDLNSTSSFEKFSKEERMQLDSLLRSARGSIEENQDDRDKYLWTQGNGTSLSLRPTLKNERMEELYADWLIDASLHENGVYDSCVSSNKSKNSFLFPGVKQASALVGKEEVFIQNNSEYSVYVFVFDDFKNGIVASQVFEKGETIKLKLTVGNNLLFVAGNDMVKYEVPKNAATVPSKNFNHHFCKVDYNFSESLFIVYKLVQPKKGKNKLMISGDSTNYIVVADLYSILET